MSQTGEEPDRDRNLRAFNLTLAAVAGQAGCLTVVVIFIALFLGLWLDDQFNTRPIITILLMVGSVPVTLVLMFWVVRKATSRITSDSNRKSESLEEDADGRRIP